MAQLLGTLSAEYLDGTTESDVIFGYQGADDLSGFGGNDTLYGGSGNDNIYGYSGDDLLYGGQGNDLMFGDSGNDTVFGGAGDDNIGGEAGNDFVLGGAGDDAIFGFDLFSNNPGAGEIDTLIGGPGFDNFYLGAFDLSQSAYSSAGNGDFALIVDFTVGIDYIVLAENDNYNLVDLSLPGFGSGVGVFVTTGGQNELIGFLPGSKASQLSLNRDFL
ncbi:calcium-binding protein [Kamptonema animale CS-326]|jgi:Ca2+-binding RTX toxin-like protein|uniref:calcium-binding protein n=1 Tax=Kamptonema animale TaxID=92934 RepID=UPI0023302C19|nr:calcium-binding protein [Kamptonema animale]MDB9509635.1 calcium-binding protein [Kamptonema animale CS-326]